MCPPQGDPQASARCMAVDDKTWAVGLRLHSEHPARSQQTPTRFHFVLDNSGSMGRNTAKAQECFSELVALASLPCSLTVFKHTADLLGSDFKTPEAMRSAPLPAQGQTNITQGIEVALDVIKKQHSVDVSSAQLAHHVLVLLSDGAHNVGTPPAARLPELGAALRQAMPELRLSVVVVGVTASSDTSMGMLLKQTLETVPLELLEPIYFAPDSSRMTEVLQELSAGLAGLRGSLVQLTLPKSQGGAFVKQIGEELGADINFIASGQEQCFLVKSSSCPASLSLDGDTVPCLQISTEDFDVELAAGALHPLLSALRVKRVAGQPDATIHAAVEQLNQLVQAIETKCSEKKRLQGDEFNLKKISPQKRVAQHKAAAGLLLHVKELRNHVTQIEAFRTSSSAEQAAFLTGKSSKFGGKALLRAATRRDGASASAAPAQVDTQQFFEDLLKDTAARADPLRSALREDVRAKVKHLSDDEKALLRDALLSRATSPEVVDALCSGEATTETDEMLDSGRLVEPLEKVLGGARHSYLSLNAPFEQLAEWCSAGRDAQKVCSNEFQLLMYLGILGYPIDVRRRDATQMNPYAMEVQKVHSSMADTASLCCAMQSSEPVVPPEGGKTIEDLLILVDPDVPRASRIIANSMLLKEAYTSVVLCRDLYMYSGNAMRIALHAHSLLTTVQPPPAARPKADIVAELRRLHLGSSYQCPECGFGPVSHANCHDLGAHHLEQDDAGGIVSNACPSCNWFSPSLDAWDQWDGTVPDALLPAASESDAAGTLAATTEASLEVALRICYSARALWAPKAEGEMHEMCQKLSSWGDSITAADGVEHPVKLLLSLACCDDVPEACLATPAVMTLLNEVCARRAHDELKMDTSLDGHSRVRSFLGIVSSSAPSCKPLGESEPDYAAVRESCRLDYELNEQAFDFARWAESSVQPWLAAIRFVRRLRACIAARGGGWKQLEADMEHSSAAYRDVIEYLKAGGGEADVNDHGLLSCLEIPSTQLKRTLATMAAQAFLHESSHSRRLKESGGNLTEPLGDVRDGDTLRSLAVDLRMEIYMKQVAEKMRQWQGVGAEMVCTKARVADIGQYARLCGSHVHGLDKPSFWGLWHAAMADGGPNGEKTREFLSRANTCFVNKYGPH